MKERYMKDLLDIRKDIDKIDEQIVKLYEERMKLTSDVAEYKINTGKQIFDKEREESKLATLQKKAESDFTRHGIRELFEQIMAMSRKKQYKLLTEHGIMPPQEFEPIHTLDYSNARIVFQGLDPQSDANVRADSMHDAPRRQSTDYSVAVTLRNRHLPA